MLTIDQRPAASPGPDHPTGYDHIAAHADGLAVRLLAEADEDVADRDYLLGYARALTDMAAAIRGGDYCPGGLFCPEDATL